jgi:hypothetical protein
MMAGRNTDQEQIRQAEGYFELGMFSESWETLKVD